MDPIRVGITSEQPQASRPVDPQRLRLVVVGNFQGDVRPSASKPLEPHRIDRDNFDDMLARIAPTITLHDRQGKSRAFTIRSLDDLHPDHLVRDPALLGAAQPAAGGAATATGNDAPEAASTSANDTAETPTLSLDDILEQSPAAAGPSGREAGNWDDVIQRLVEPLTEAARAPAQPDRTSEHEQLADALRHLLRQPDFQQLEAAWRGLAWLVRQGDDETCAIYLVDADKQQLRAACEQPELARGVAEVTGGGPSVIVCLECFTADEDDVALLRTITECTLRLQVPWVASAAGELIGWSPDAGDDARDWRPFSNEQQARWQALRSEPGAAWVALVWPRYLVRLPYGQRTQPIESFKFEELAGEFHHEQLTWGASSLVFAALAARAFEASGTDMRLGDVTRLSGLPLLILEEDGEKFAHPCGETLLSEREARHIAERGVIPLLSVRGEDVVQLASFHSLAADRSPLRGPWR